MDYKLFFLLGSWFCGCAMHVICVPWVCEMDLDYIPVSIKCVYDHDTRNYPVYVLEMSPRRWTTSASKSAKNRQTSGLFPRSGGGIAQFCCSLFVFIIYIIYMPDVMTYKVTCVRYVYNVLMKRVILFFFSFFNISRDDDPYTAAEH